MDGSDLIFIVLPIVIPLVLAIGIALPFIADSRAARERSDQQAARGAYRHLAGAYAPDQALSSARRPERTPSASADRAA
jgi:hypothetical protein